MAERHTHLLDTVLSKDNHLFPDDLKEVIHALRNEGQEAMLLRKLGEARMDLMEQMFKGHIESCDRDRVRSNDNMNVLLSSVEQMKAKQKEAITPADLRRAVLWLGGIAAACSAVLTFGVQLIQLVKLP